MFWGILFSNLDEILMWGCFGFVMLGVGRLSRDWNWFNQTLIFIKKIIIKKGV